MDHLIEDKAGYFVWTKSGRMPHYRHDTFESALAEAKRLANENPGRKFIVQHWLVKVSVGQGVAEKEPAMENTQNQQSGQPTGSSQHTVWAGAKDNTVGFARQENTLNEQGYINPQSFTVSGDIDGIQFLDSSQG